MNKKHMRKSRLHFGAGLFLCGFLFGLCSSHAQEIAEVFVFQGEEFEQASAGATSPSPHNPFVFRTLALAGQKNMVTVAPTIKPPGGAAHTLTSSSDSSDFYFRFEEGLPTQAALSTAYPNGQYTFTFTGQFSGAHSVNINFPAGTIPPGPQILNFADAQSIDPDNDFELKWSPFSGGTADDMIEVKVSDSPGNVVASSPAPGSSDALDGTTTSFVIEAGSLEAGQTYTAAVSFYKVTGRSFATIPLPFTAYFAETKLSIKTSGGGGPTDTTPPTLLSAQPPDNFVLPITNYFNFPAMFVFSEQMLGAQSVQWSANIDPAKVHYQWLPDSGTPSKMLLATYEGGWPASAHITWTLNPAANAPGNFQDTAGNQLAANTYKGGFLTGPGDSDSICEGSDPVLGAGFGILKTIHNYQNSAGAVSLAPTNGATFTAFYDQNGQLDLSVITLLIASIHKLDVLTPPNDSVNTIRFFTDVKTNAAELDQSYPATVYEIQQRNNQVQTTNSVQLNVSADAYPPVPHFLNLPVAPGTDLKTDLTVNWQPFADEASAGLTILEVYDAAGNQVFRTPDACVGRTLPAAAGSALIPGGRLQPDNDYTFVLTFYKFSEEGKTLPGIAGKGIAALAESTAVSLRPKNDVIQPEPAKLHQFLSAGVVDGKFQFQFSAWAGSNYVLEAASDLTPPANWSLVQSAQSATQLLQIFDDQWQLFPHRFYRIRMIDGSLPTLVANGPSIIDTSRSATETIDEDGGELSVTSLAGDVYTLHFAPNSLFLVEDVSMTVIDQFQGLPLSGGFIGGVQLAPADLLLPINATLTIKLANPVPATIAAVVYNSGSNSFYLVPHTVETNVITIPVDRLGSILLGNLVPGDLAYFEQNKPADLPDLVLQTTALLQQRSDVAQRAQSRIHANANPPSPADTLRNLFNDSVYPQLLSVQDGVDSEAIIASFNGYIIWADQVSQANLQNDLAAEIENANNVVKATINNRVLIQLDRAAQHDYDAIVRLVNLRNAIKHQPWGPTWVPGAGQTLLDRINKMLKMKVIFDSSTLYEASVGDVSSKVHGEVDYNVDGEPNTIKGQAPINFVEHSHYQPPSPCTVIPAPAPGTMTVMKIGFYGKHPQTQAGKYILTDLRLYFWSDHLSEHDQIICPGGGATLEYWFPGFVYFHENELAGFTPVHSAPGPAWRINRGWKVSQSGNADIGKKDYHNSAPFKEMDLTEESTLSIRHTPEQ
jgi:hypothetical protein